MLPITMKPVKKPQGKNTVFGRAPGALLFCRPSSLISHANLNPIQNTKDSYRNRTGIATFS